MYPMSRADELNKKVNRSTFRIKPTGQGDSQMAQTIHYCTRTQRPRRDCQTCFWMFECVSCRSTVSSVPWGRPLAAADLGQECGCPLGEGSSWSQHTAAHRQTTHKLEQVYKRNFALLKIQDTTDFPTGIWQRRWNLGTDFGRSVGLIIRTPRMGKQTLHGHKLNFLHTRAREKGGVSPQETEPGLPVCPISEHLRQRTEGTQAHTSTWKLIKRFTEHGPVIWDV